MCQSLFFNKVVGLSPATLLKKETLAQVFSCEFCKISKNTFLHRKLLVAASGDQRKPIKFQQIYRLFSYDSNVARIFSYSLQVREYID